MTLGTKSVKVVATCGLVLTCAGFGLAGCAAQQGEQQQGDQQQTQQTPQQTEALSAGDSSEAVMDRSNTDDGVAATVNGAQLGEKSVTAYIELVREENGLQDDTAWAEWLASEGYTPADYRASIINEFVEDELVAQIIKNNNIEVTDEDIDNYITAQLGEMNDKQYQNYLNIVGMSDARFRDVMKKAVQKKKVSELAESEGKTYNEYLEEQKKDDNVTISDMPSGLSYDVDMSGLEIHERTDEEE